MENLLLASTSTLYKGEYLEYILPELESLFQDTKTIVFIPFARPGGISHDEYSVKVATAFAKINKSIESIHHFQDLEQAIENAKGIFIGGGNTFVLLDQLYKHNLMQKLANAIKRGVPYLGCSAGCIIAGPNMQTTNDMPIVYPPSFQALDIIPFNINAHYFDHIPNFKHNGESRETRIKEFHSQNNIPVIGLPEGDWIRYKEEKISLEGNLPAKLFQQNKETVEIYPTTTLNFYGLYKNNI